ncbi:MAG: arylsulfatase [Gemmataceae bacterium]
MPRTLSIVLALALICALPSLCFAGSPKKPNIILIMTDDQGHGDLGFHGNPVIRTPHLDKFAKQSVRFKNFFVCPVCSPTRSSLLTGRYNYRTGIVDTYLGRSMMHSDELTLAEMLRTAGYRTGIVGKWHLGDNYPLRPMDQGFQETLVHQGGGIGQPADPPKNSYFDPILFKNGNAKRYKGYCSDIFTDAAMDFVTKHKKQPFFLYLAFNCPHNPLQVPQKYYQMYKNKDLSHSAFPKVGQPLRGKAKQDDLAKIYGMVTNIDDNFGRLMAKLAELGIAENTIVIFLTDNGPQSNRYNSGMLAWKGSVHEGGTRVPCFVRWPAHLPQNQETTCLGAHIDIVPTLLAACNVRQPNKPKHKLDGINLLPHLKDTKKKAPDRTIFFQWHRGDEPEKFRAFAVRTANWRLVQPNGVRSGQYRKDFQLYKITEDPYQKNNVANKYPKVLAKLKKAYTNWFEDVGSTRGYAPPRIAIGSKYENPVVLTRQDWRGPKATWGKKGLGHWEVKVYRAGKYDITLKFDPVPKATSASIKIKGPGFGFGYGQSVPAGTRQITARRVQLKTGNMRLSAHLGSGQHKTGVRYVIVERKD